MKYVSSFLKRFNWILRDTLTFEFPNDIYIIFYEKLIESLHVFDYNM